MVGQLGAPGFLAISFWRFPLQMVHALVDSKELTRRVTPPLLCTTRVLTRVNSLGVTSGSMTT